MRATWVLTVVSETMSSLAISALESPRATCLKTSSSRGVSSSRPGGGAAGRAAAGELLDQAARDRGREQRLAVGDDPDAGDQLLGGRVLEQEAAGAGAQGLVDVLVEVEGRQDQHPDLARALGHHLARGLEPVEVGHADVHEHDVGPQRARRAHRLGAVLGLAHHLDVLLGVEDHAEAGAHEGLVVGEQDAHGAHSGSLACTA